MTTNTLGLHHVPTHEQLTCSWVVEWIKEWVSHPIASGYSKAWVGDFFSLGLWMLLYKCSVKVVLIFAPRIWWAQVLGNQEWYVAPKGKWAEFWCHDLLICVKQNSGRQSIRNGVAVCLLRNLSSKHQGRRWRIRSSTKQKARGKRTNTSMRINCERKEDGAVVV